MKIIHLSQQIKKDLIFFTNEQINILTGCVLEIITNKDHFNNQKI